MDFKINAQLQQDSIEIGRFALSRVLLINDSQYPWLVLVPEREAITEVYQLAEKDQLVLQQESSLVAKQLANFYQADKMNVAAIGNVVPQLHVHHVARYKNDKAWPAPVWGKFKAVPYDDEELESIKTQLLALFKAHWVY